MGVLAHLFPLPLTFICHLHLSTCVGTRFAIPTGSAIQHRSFSGGPAGLEFSYFSFGPLCASSPTRRFTSCVVFLDKPVGCAEIVARLEAKGVPTGDAELYAGAFLKNKSNTVRKLATLKESHLKEMDVAIGDLGVVLQALQEWLAELNTATSGLLSFLSLPPSSLSTPLPPLLSPRLHPTFPMLSAPFY